MHFWKDKLDRAVVGRIRTPIPPPSGKAMQKWRDWSGFTDVVTKQCKISETEWEYHTEKKWKYRVKGDRYIDLMWQLSQKCNLLRVIFKIYKLSYWQTIDCGYGCWHVVSMLFASCLKDVIWNCGFRIGLAEIKYWISTFPWSSFRYCLDPSFRKTVNN